MACLFSQLMSGHDANATSLSPSNDIPIDEVALPGRLEDETLALA